MLTSAWVVIPWCLFLVAMLATGGYFMFRKFLKSLPREDGKSDLDWQEYYIEQTLPLWTEEGKALLKQLVEPVPSLFRETAKRSIAGKIGQLALEEQAESITHELIIRGYILATPKRDHKYLIKRLRELQIDPSLYSHLFEQSPQQSSKSASTR